MEEVSINMIGQHTNCIQVAPGGAVSLTKVKLPGCTAKVLAGSHSGEILKDGVKC